MNSKWFENEHPEVWEANNFKKEVFSTYSAIVQE